MSYIKVTDLKTGEVLRDSRQEHIRDAIEQLKKENEMSNLPAVKEFTPAEIDLIKSTIAKGATHDELKLFLYRCKNLGLDPLKPGQIYFIKYGSSPGTIVVGLEGFRSKAAATGKHSGTRRGILKDESGKCIGAWCEVSRSDWTGPAREEVSLSEYNTGKAMWAKMPETMIKKVAEAAALRMAFPDDLGGVYVNEEMDQAGEPKETVRIPIEGTIGNGEIKEQHAARPENPGDYVISFGKKYRDKKIKDIEVGELGAFIEWCEDTANKKGLPLSHEASLLKINFNAYLDQEVDKANDGQIPPSGIDDSDIKW